MRTLFSHKYILTLILGMLAVQAMPCAAQNGSTDDIKLFKRTEPTGNNDEYRITLESFVTGRAIVEQVTKPVDLTLILDVSTSMSASQGDQWHLSNFVQLTTGDNIGILHTSMNNSGVNNYAHRYKIVIDRQEYYLYYNNNKWYYSTKWNWDNGNGWQQYTRNSSADIIKTDVKIDLLQEACRVFINQIRQSSYGNDGALGGGDDIDHRIGFATFCGTLMQWVEISPINNANVTVYTATEWQGTNNSEVKTYTTKTISIDQFINELHLHQGGSTCPDRAFVKSIEEYVNLDNSLTPAQKANRSKVSVMFTDGKPQDNGANINDILRNSYTLKHTYNAKVFTVGIFSNENDNLNDPDDDYTIKQYMQWTSSLYPDAQSKTNRGNVNTDGISYYQKSDGSDLKSIFEAIAQAAGADVYSLTSSDAAAIDVMSDDFTLPANMPTTAVTIRQWFCIGTTDEEDSDPDANTKIRGGYVFRLITKNTTTGVESITGSSATTYNGKIHPDGPYCYQIVDDATTGDQRVIVRGFDYSVDDTYNGQNITTYGNWVGMHGLQKNIPAGKMLEFSFLVTLKPESMGGFGLPSNKISSGIYKNTGTETDPEYTQIVAAYPKPLVNVPSIYILKQGLKYGESAVFTVTRTTNALGTAIKAGEEGYIQYKVILSQTGADGTDCFAVIKSLDAGKYKVEENTDWSWTYTPATGFGPSQERELHTPDPTGYADMQAFKADIKTRQNGADYGKIGVTGWDSEANRYYVTGNLTKDASEEELNDNTSLHLLFKFVNSKKTSTLPLNDEAFTVNVFGEGGGSAEHGGVDPEVEL